MMIKIHVNPRAVKYGLTTLLSLSITFFTVCAQHPAGDIVGPVQLTSAIYPGTVRNYWVYVPKQYVAASPACLLIVQDGLNRAKGWKLPQVLDSLIAAHRIPVMIGVFVDPGTVPASRNDAFPRYNRSLEYDALGDRYARFLVNELLPEIQKSYSIKPDPDSRCIAGASSGAICAFNAAWERPDQFRRVLSTIGTYVGLRGGEAFTTLVRKSEPKPIRIFLEDGSSDLNIYAGDWWASNQAMLSALAYSGYEVNHRWGTGGHDSEHAAAIMAEALEWLWKDYPAPVSTHKGIKPRMDLLVDGEDWQAVETGTQSVNQITVNRAGDLYFVDQGALYRINHEQRLTRVTAERIDRVSAGPSGLLGWIKSSRKIVSIDADGKLLTLASNCDAEYLCASAQGLYFSDGAKRQIGYYDFARKSLRYFTTDFLPGAIALSAEKTFLNVGSRDTAFGYSFKVNSDGSLQDGQEYVHYHSNFGQPLPGVRGIEVDASNALYSATDLGVQVSDQLGRVNFIFSKATTRVDDVKLVGNLLYVSGDGKLFVRKIGATGVRSFEAPVTPPKPQL